MKGSLVAFLALALTGCAALECNTDWFETGRRDGLMGADYEIESYVERCEGNVDRARYRAGWEDGSGQRPRGSAF